MHYTRLIAAACILCIQRENYIIRLILRVARSIVQWMAGGARGVCSYTAATVDTGKTMGPKKYTSPTNRYVFQRCGAYPAAISRKCVRRSAPGSWLTVFWCVRERDQTIFTRKSYRTTIMRYYFQIRVLMPPTRLYNIHVCVHRHAYLTITKRGVCGYYIIYINARD